MASKPSVIVTGGSGLLGRALMTTLQESGQFGSVVGTALSRIGPNLVKLDLMDLASVQKFIEERKPNFLVHAAAMRFPDQVEKNPEAAAKINVEATETLAKCLKACGGKMVYICTDYVFDGTSPPYRHTDAANPINTYGQLKLDGEKATLAADPGNLSLRIPLIYGPVEYLGESAVTTAFKLLLQPSENDVVSNYEIRRPAHVNDIAHVVLRLLAEKDKRGIEIQGVYQWSGSESFTKYNMVQIMARVLKRDASHVKPNAEKPPEGGTKRPYDVTLDTSRLLELGIEQHTPFEIGVKDALEPWNK